jgi:hypothetical protein
MLVFFPDQVPDGKALPPAEFTVARIRASG